MKHTPGPWELRNEFGMQGLVYPNGKAYPVAAVTGYYSGAGQSEPNARLIAAVPELLQALQAVVAGHRDHDIWLGLVRAAIAKATGAAA